MSKIMKVDVKDICAGASLVGCGVYFFASSFRYGIGSASHMGPGFFPMWLGIIGMAIGGLIALPAFGRPTALPEISWRPFLAVSASVALFCVTLAYFGLIPAVFVTICVCSLADASVRPWPTLVLALATSVASWLVFVVALGLQVPAFGALR